MRARFIRPGFFLNELLGTSHPDVALLFIGLWCLADREGRLEDRPLRIKAAVFPYREVDINGYLTVLSRLGFIQRYVVGPDKYIAVVNFQKHQSPHNTEKKSTIPEPPPFTPPQVADNTCERELTVNSPLNNGEVTVNPSLYPVSCITDPVSCITNPVEKEEPPLPPFGKGEVVEGIPYDNIIHTFNRVAGGKRYTAKPYRKFIKACWEQGHREPDFSLAAANAFEQHGDDPKWCSLIRPDYVYRPDKIQSYLNYKPVSRLDSIKKTADEWLKRQQEKEGVVDADF